VFTFPETNRLDLMKPVLFGLIVGGLILFVTACGTSDPLWKPSFANMARPAPDSFDVEMVTSAGTVDFRFYRKWAPLGVDRAFYLFKHNFYEGTRFYRVIDGFVAQFGGSGDGGLDSLWRDLSINDEPVIAPNKKGTIAFARSGARTRSMIMYVNLENNFRLDSLESSQVVGYPPIGKVISGMDVISSLYSDYGAAPMRTDLTSKTLAEEYSRLDSIASTAVTRMW